MKNINLKSLFNIDENEEIIHQIPCSYQNLSFGILYLTNNYICFNSIVYYNQSVVIPISDILSMKISKNNNSIIIRTLFKIHSKPLYTFSNFNNIEQSFDLINRGVDISNGKKNPVTNTISRLSLLKEKNKILNLNNTEREIKFKELEDENEMIICQKKINLSSKDFFEKFFYPKQNQKEDYSYPQFYESLEDHINIKPENWENDEEKLMEEEKKNKYIYSKKRNITFCLKVKGIPFINESNVTATHSFKANDIKKEYFLYLESESEGVPLANCFRVIENYQIYPLNDNGCVIRGTGYPFFKEQTFLKPIIITSVTNTFKMLNGQWMNYIKSKGFIVEDYGKVKALNCDHVDNCEKKKM